MFKCEYQKKFSVTNIFLLVNCSIFSVSITVTVIFIFQSFHHFSHCYS